MKSNLTTKATTTSSTTSTSASSSIARPAARHATTTGTGTGSTLLHHKTSTTATGTTGVRSTTGTTSSLRTRTTTSSLTGTRTSTRTTTTPTTSTSPSPRTTRTSSLYAPTASSSQRSTAAASSSATSSSQRLGSTSLRSTTPSSSLSRTKTSSPASSASSGASSPTTTARSSSLHRPTASSLASSSRASSSSSTASSSSTTTAHGTSSIRRTTTTSSATSSSLLKPTAKVPSKAVSPTPTRSTSSTTLTSKSPRLSSPAISTHKAKQTPAVVTSPSSASPSIHHEGAVKPHAAKEAPAAEPKAEEAIKKPVATPAKPSAALKQMDELKDELDELEGLTAEDLDALDDIDEDDLMADLVDKSADIQEVKEEEEPKKEEKEEKEEHHEEEHHEEHHEEQHEEEEELLDDLTEEELKELKELEEAEAAEAAAAAAEAEAASKEVEEEEAATTPAPKENEEDNEVHHEEDNEVQEGDEEMGPVDELEDDLYGEAGGLLENEKMLDELTSLYDALEIARLDKELAEEKVFEYEETISQLQEEIRIRDEKLALDISDVDVRTVVDENNRMKAAILEIQQVSEEESREAEEIINELEAKNAELAAELEAKSEELERCTEERNELKELLDQLYEVQTQLESLTEENSELKERNAALKQSVEEFEELKELSESVEAMQSEELAKVKAQLREMEDDEIEYKRAIEAALEKVQQKDILIAQLRDTAERLRRSEEAEEEEREAELAAAELAERAGASAAAEELLVKIHTLEAKAAALTIEGSIAELATSHAEERLRFYRANLPEEFLRGDMLALDVKLGLDRVERKAHALRRLLEEGSHFSAEGAAPDEALYFAEMCLVLADIEYAANAFAYRMINIRTPGSAANLANELTDLEHMLRGLEKTVDGVLLLAKRDQLTVSYPLYTLTEVKERLTAAAASTKLFDETAAIAAEDAAPQGKRNAFLEENETRRVSREIAYKLGRLLLHCRGICAVRAGIDALSRSLRATHPDFEFDADALSARTIAPVPLARIEECIREGLGTAGVLETGAAVSFANGMSLGDVLKALIDANIAVAAAAADYKAAYTALKTAGNDGDSAAFEEAAKQAEEKIGWASVVTFIAPVATNISKIEIFRKTSSVTSSMTSMYSSCGYNYLSLDNWFSARVRMNREEISEINNTKRDLEMLKGAHERLNAIHNQSAVQITELRSLNASLQEKVTAFMAEIDAVKKKCEEETLDQRKALDLSKKEIADLKKDLFDERMRAQKAAAAMAATASMAAASAAPVPSIAPTPLLQKKMMTSSLRTRSTVSNLGGGAGGAAVGVSSEEVKSLKNEIARLKARLSRLSDENKKLEERVLSLNVRAIQRTNAGSDGSASKSAAAAEKKMAGSYSSRLMMHMASAAVVDLRNKKDWVIGNALVSNDLRAHIKGKS